MKSLLFGAFLLFEGILQAANLPEPPTPIIYAPRQVYQPSNSIFGYPSPWYVPPPSYSRPFDSPYYYQSQPSMYYICGNYGLYYTQRIR